MATPARPAPWRVVAGALPTAGHLLFLSLFAGILACQPIDGAAGEDASAASGTTDAGATALALAADPWPNEASGATARYDLAAKDWHAQPFPTNSRRDAQGRLDLSGFPPPREGGMPGIIQQYLDYASDHVRGWSLQPTIYVQFDRPLTATMVRKPAESLTQNSYFLMDVDPSSPEYGKLVPLIGQVSAHQRLQHLQPDLFMVQPVWGRPLRPKTTYAFVLRRGVRDAEGKVLARPAALAAVLDAALGGVKGVSDPEQQRLADTLQPLIDAYQAGKLTVPWRDIAAATVFSTGNPTSQLKAMAQWVRDKAPAQAATAWKKTASSKKYVLYTATYEAPNFQKGKCPYDDDGDGAFELKSDATPVVQRTETMRVAVAVPLTHVHVSADGLMPVAMYAHGTGGDWMSFVGEKVVDNLAARGVAMVSIDQPLHGPRCEVPQSGGALDLHTFNFLNVAAGRTGFQQSALDSVMLSRLLRQGHLDVPEGVAADGKAVHFDPQRVVFIGHSQGGLSGSLLAAVDPHQVAYVLSGAGAGISLTVMLRKHPADIANTLGVVLGLDKGELSQFHPAVSLVQLLADVTDPLSYGHSVLHRDNGERPPHVLLTEGLLDQATPSDTSEALAAVLGLQVLSPKAHFNDALELAKTSVVASPAQENLMINGFAVTGVLSQWPTLDHFVIFKSKEAQALYSVFLESAIDSGAAIAELP